MKKSATSYKALYTACLRQQAGFQDTISMQQEQILFQQEQLLLLQQERETKDAILFEQDQLICHQHQLLQHKDEQLEAGGQTIFQQGEQLVQHDHLIKNQEQKIVSLQQEVTNQHKLINSLQRSRHELKALKKWVHGIRSEKRPLQTGTEKPGEIVQGTLILDADEYGVCQISSRKVIAEHIRNTVVISPKTRGGRNDLPKGLEEEIVTLDVNPLPAGAKLVRIDEQRQLACSPLRWYIKVTRRPVYIVSSEDGLYAKKVNAPLPPHPIPRCKVDISILIMLLTDKFLYHLPICRQWTRFKQYGVNLPYSTLAYYVNRICEVLRPLWELLYLEVVRSGIIHADESNYKVLDDTKKKGKKSHLGWMWAILSPIQRIACFQYQPGRGKKDIADVLSGYKGYLLTDAYGVYTKYGQQPGVIHQKCMAHIRRYFMRALDNDRQLAAYALDNFFAPLYKLEAQCKAADMDYDEIKQERQQKAVPILNAFKQWLGQQLPLTIPRTPIYQAINYALSNFEGIMVYTTEGFLQIDNNILEAQIRPIALGRHNFMFAGSHDGAVHAAIIYSLLATCRLQGINPIHWLDDILRRISTHPKDKYIELLPQYWKPARA
jgi:transposase